jgi:hypothetical protein
MSAFTILSIILNMSDKVTFWYMQSFLHACHQPPDSPQSRILPYHQHEDYIGEYRFARQAGHARLLGASES